MDGGASELDQWREIAAQKEKEWKEVTEQRIWTLETACQEKEKVLCEERAKFQKLKEDFKYNLKLLAERDQELDRYDTTFSDLRAQLNTKSVEISECKIQLDELQTQLNCEQKSREELQLHYQARIREKQTEIDSYKNTKDGELNEERKEFESFKRKLQRKLTEVEEEMDAQKRELSSGFEEAMRKREHEFRIQADEMSTKVLEYELKAKLLGKELELVRSAQEKNSQEFQKVEDNHRVLEKKLKGKDWELEDLKAMKDAMITDLQNQIQQNESIIKRQQEEYDRKHQEMDKYCREKESALTTAKESFTERESELQGTVRDLQSKLEVAEVAKRQLQWAGQDLEKEKNSYINKLQTEIQQLKEKWDKQIVEVSRSQVNKDQELQNIRETEEKLKMEIIQKKEDIERYKKELSLSVEREAALERSKTQVELDWQRRYEDLERQHYEKSEDFIKKITRSRDEALATVKEKERELQQRETLIRALKTDREQAIATLRNHGIKLEKNVNVETTQDTLDSFEDVSTLQEQNSNLRAVIKEMRAQMEQLGHQIPDVNLQPKRGTKLQKVDYVKGLEKEVRELRQKNREMEQDANVARRFGRQPTQVPTSQDQVMAEVKDNFLVKTHIQSLNDLIGSLRSEKLELSAQVKKHQVHIQYQEQTMEKMAKEQREKQVELDQMQYEIGAVTRRTQTEIASLRQKISELELALVEARKEADEYYKGNLERNMEVVALGQELSGLKIELAQKRPTINYGAQELLIQQLQDEIKHLRDEGPDFSVGSDISKPPNVQIKNLQQKLRGAAKKISELAKEKQQLIEIGNKLRAELKAGIDIPMMGGASKRKPFPSPAIEESGSHMTSSQPIPERFVNKLTQLEQLQYQLTRQELQFAQKYPKQEGQKYEAISDTDEYRPPSILKKSGNKLRDSLDTEVNVRASVNTEGGETFLSAQSLPSARSQLMMSMSSMGGESLQEIWKMLDEGRPSPTPRLPSPGYPQRDTKSAPPGKEGHPRADKDITNSGNFLLAGKQTGQPRDNSKLEKKLTNRIGGKVTKNVSQKPKIRNYNLRDDSSIT